MTKSSQTRAVKTYRAALKTRGIARFEVLGLERDRVLIRALAKRLADGGAEAERLRESIGRQMTPQPSTKGRIWQALRDSPLVGADLDLTREVWAPRPVDL
ncbi:MAG: hypothetical protein IT548_07235 [Alphaproteobacteria bacterium]|nr:hypothetical protein [Alphaproteobacteria bacterium]